MRKIGKILSSSSIFFFAVLLIVTACKKEDVSNDIKDGDGNIYTTVKIGSQTWLTKNLKTTKYNDGTNIPLVTLSTDWKGLSTPAYCYYDNDPINKDIYGALYNWYVVNTGKLCPKGFHIPTKDEWIILGNFLGMEAGGAMKSTTLWNTPNTGATNISGFTGLPGGQRTDNDAAVFEGKGNGGYFWSSTQSNAFNAYNYYLSSNDAILNNYDYTKTLGSSCRCLKD